MMDLTGLLPWAGLAGATLAEADVVIGGIPYDGSAAYRKGAAEAPERIRSLSPVMPPVTEDGRHLFGMAVHDLGDLDAGLEIETGWHDIADALAGIPQRALLTMMGGDHCSTIPIVAAQARRHPDLRVLWFDAHPDLCDFSRGGAWTCGCALRRALEVAGLAPSSAAVAGGRDYDLEELEFMKQHRMLLIGTPELSRSPEAAARRVAAWAGGRPLHVSFDIDVLTREALDFLAALAGGAKLVGLDVTEVAPPVDHNDITSLAALKILFEFWGRAWKPRT